MDTLKQVIGKRLEQIRIRLGLTQDEMGDHLGKGKGSISKYENGDAAPSLEAISKYADIGHVSFDWIFIGEKPLNIVSEPHEEYTATLPVRGMAGAGDPCCINQLEPIGQITVSKDYNGPNIQVIQIRGTSMEPTYMDGAHVGVDITSKEVISGQTYAVYIPHEGIVVKRIWIGPELVTIASDNSAAPSHDVIADRINWDTFIQGRVKWVIQTIY